MPRHDVNKDATSETRRKGAEKAAEAKRRKRDVERALIAEARAEHLDDAIARLSEAAERAATTITALLDDPASAVRRCAAKDVLELLVDFEVIAMSDRISRLEEIAAGRNGKP